MERIDTIGLSPKDIGFQFVSRSSVYAIRTETGSDGDCRGRRLMVSYMPFHFPFGNCINSILHPTTEENGIVERANKEGLGYGYG